MFLFLKKTFNAVALLNFLKAAAYLLFYSWASFSTHSRQRSPSPSRIEREWLLTSRYLPGKTKTPYYPWKLMKQTYQPISMSCTLVFFPTVCFIFMYISCNPDRLFKTECYGHLCSKMLWRYVGIIQGCSNYVLYIISWGSCFIVQFIQFSGC